MSTLDNDPNYTRLLGPEGQEIGELGRKCGHHCYVTTVGGTKTQKHIHHCNCDECHEGKLNGRPKE